MLQCGYLLTWMVSFAGNDERSDVNIGAFQPFGIFQLGGGAYLYSTGIWVYDFERDTYSILLGLGVCQVILKRKTVYSVFAELQWPMADKGVGRPQWQVFVGFNIQFKSEWVLKKHTFARP